MKRIKAQRLSRLNASGLTAVQLPGDIVYNVGLQQEVATWQQVFSDEVLVGPHSDAVTHTKRAQDIQDLKAGPRR